MEPQAVRCGEGELSPAGTAIPIREARAAVKGLQKEQSCYRVIGLLIS